MHLLKHDTGRNRLETKGFAIGIDPLVIEEIDEVLSGTTAFFQLVSTRFLLVFACFYSFLLVS